jgi:hypothetical protein
VDVGGGIGSTSIGLAKAFGHLRFVVQDRGVVVDMGVKVRVFCSIHSSALLLSLLPSTSVSAFVLFFFFFASGHCDSG